MPLTDPIVYVDGKERRTLDLRPDGVECIPLLGLSNFQSVRTGTEEHVHPGCVEVSLCVRGNLMFESFGECYPFLPGTVFVSQPTEPHRMRHNPKGLMLYRILFKIPSEGESVLLIASHQSATGQHQLHPQAFASGRQCIGYRSIQALRLLTPVQCSYGGVAIKHSGSRLFLSVHRASPCLQREPAAG